MINDGSTEPYIEEILKLAEERDSRFKYFYKRNSGLSDTRNYGIEIAQGDYITFVDSDDYLENDALKYMIDKIEETKSDVSMFGFFIDNNIDDREVFRKLYTARDKETISRDILLRNNWWAIHGFILCSAWAKIFRREVIIQNKLKFIKNIYAEDDFFTLDFINVINTFYVDNKQLYHYVTNNNSLTHYFNSQIVNQIAKELHLLDCFIAHNYSNNRHMDNALVQHTYYYVRVIKHKYFTHPQNKKTFWELKSEMTEFLTDPKISEKIKWIRLFDANDIIDFKNRLLLKLHLYWVFLITERKKRRKKHVIEVLS